MFPKKHLLIICSFFIIIACDEDIKISFSEINISSEHNNIVEVNIPKANGNKAIADNINSEIQKIIITALHIGESDSITSKSIEESILMFNQEYNTFKTDFPETLPTWDAQIDGEIMFQSSEIISLAITAYINTGGAHGTLHISSLSFETETGRIISNSKLFNNVEDFKKIAKTYLNEALKEKDLVLDNESFKLPANIAYSEHGLVLLYNTNEIASYSDGIIEFVIPFGVAKPYLVFNSL
jgi:hypothetical protein